MMVPTNFTTTEVILPPEASARFAGIRSTIEGENRDRPTNGRAPPRAVYVRRNIPTDSSSADSGDRDGPVWRQKTSRTRTRVGAGHPWLQVRDERRRTAGGCATDQVVARRREETASVTCYSGDFALTQREVAGIASYAGGFFSPSGNDLVGGTPAGGSSSFIADLKPRMACPNPRPSSGSFLPPNRTITITRISRR